MSTVSVVIWGTLHLKSGLAAARSGQRDLADAQALIRVTASAAVPELSEPSR